MSFFKRKKNKDFIKLLKKKWKGKITEKEFCNELEKETKEERELRKSEIMATKEEIYEKFNEFVKRNHLKLSKETLSHISGFKILRIKKEHGMNTIEFEYKWHEKTHKNSPSSSMYKAEDWSSVLYGGIFGVYGGYDPQDHDLKIKEAVKKADKEAERNLARDGVVKKMGYCYIFWGEKKQILKDKYGIDWKSPADRYPNTKFD